MHLSENEGIEGNTFVVTGGLGFVGSTLCLELVRRGAREVRSLDKRSTSPWSNHLKKIGVRCIQVIQKRNTSVTAAPLPASLTLNGNPRASKRSKGRPPGTRSARSTPAAATILGFRRQHLRVTNPGISLLISQMDFSRFSNRLSRLVGFEARACLSSAKTTKDVLPVPSLSVGYSLEMGPLRSHCDSVQPNKDSISTHALISGYESRFYLPSPPSGLGSCRSIHGGLVLTQAFTETGNENPNPVDDRTMEDSEKICKILSNHSGFSGIESSLDRSGVKVSPSLVEEVLKKLSNAGVLALLFFRWAEKQEGFKHTTEIYNALMDALGKIKQFKLMWNLVNTMKSKALLTKDTFALIIRRYARARKIKEATETFEKMEKFCLKPELSDFNRYIDTLCKSRHVKKAQEVFDEMKKRRFTPDLRTYTILLEGWGQEQNEFKLKEVYTEMRGEGLQPDVVTYGIIINAFCKLRKYNEAIDLFREMEIKNLKPSPHIYCTLINGLGAEKRLKEALEFFEQSKAKGFKPEEPTYNAVIGAYCQSTRMFDAYRVVDEMRQYGVGPNARTYEIILHHLIKAGRRKEAFSLFQRTGTEFGCEPSLNIYSVIVKMFCDEERTDMAQRVWNEMKAKGFLPGMHMFSVLIKSLCDENKLDDACKYFQEMLDLGIRPPGQMYSKLKEALLEDGRKDIALILWQKLETLRKKPLVG
ncbi:pentatricopeptide repeat-containing protein At1g71060, mitochondrial [Telopea speciosissima]|uniref:pentatricopeptide repeat-containing protein At1g71060, mitochondrial n=1 Tax=Telopea speciosissima TaxID=54955 RepID=UPI001CC5673A|nr:pentatricopeptide repeat-containing protein At1g71060, mitochondrial [Telopea speciosissima]